MYIDGLDENENRLRYRQYDPDADRFEYRTAAEAPGVEFVRGFVRSDRHAPQFERRASQSLELRQEGEQPPTLVGTPVVYNSQSVDLGGFYEIVRPGAFGADLGRHDVRALVDHDPALIIGRSKSGTLTLSDTAAGLRAEIVPPDTTAGRDVVTSVRRGDLDGMSFGFRVIEDRWPTATRDDGRTIREIIAAELLDVSVVAYPAYQDTAVALRARATAQDHAATAQRDHRRRMRWLRIHENA